jgi:FtsH-binding integral membrane protein
MPKVFMWMFIGLLVTFGTGYLVSLNQNMVVNIFSGITRFIIILGTLGVGIVLGTLIHKMNTPTAICLYLLYTFLTGLTISMIFVVYKITFILAVFVVAALLFGTFALIGKVVKLDLSKFYTYLIMGLIGVVSLGIVNMFLKLSWMYILISWVSLIVFLGYTAVDIQRISKMYADEEESSKLAVIGAFSLYLDYINIVIDLINLFGGSNRRD